MNADVTTEPIVHEQQIDASPETVFAFFTDPEKLTRWLAVEAAVDPRPGGACRQTHLGRDGNRYLMRGEFVELKPPSRVVFTWGFENENMAVRPGASTVEVTLKPRDGGTWLRLVHRDLPQSERADHDEGWETMLSRLATAAVAARSRIRFPGESPDYRTARDRLLEAEIQLRRQTEAVAAMRRALPPGGAVPNGYRFEEDGGDVHLSELFGPSHDTLVLYSFMYSTEMERPCPACTSILDSLDGAAPHLARRVALAAVAKSPGPRFRAFARERGWRNLRLLSSAGRGYNRDYHGEARVGSQMPMLNMFTRRDGAVRHHWAARFSTRRRSLGRTSAAWTSSGRSGTCSTRPPRVAGQTGTRAWTISPRSALRPLSSLR